MLRHAASQLQLAPEHHPTHSRVGSLSPLLAGDASFPAPFEISNVSPTLSRPPGGVNPLSPQGGFSTPPPADATSHHHYPHRAITLHGSPPAVSARLLLVGDINQGRASLQRPPVEHDVGLRPVDGVVNPAPRLLHAQTAPLSLGKKAALGEQLGDVRREHDVPVLVDVVVVFLGVLDLRHLDEVLGRYGASR
eukprot:CAMPEP_0197592556 /NCGR_PEP_ID=MMETSP1326-20131121/15157_1 /TAXON_ID=1155430 /ORGANISM="Genus nov. species nov., Strain RCC2288" /LENGTH=192 /DNA_ID=CAMNT_0043158265 /DNA_START=183 /DNA_END=757 /DNA_ORIENTATION=-